MQSHMRTMNDNRCRDCGDDLYGIDYELANVWGRLCAKCRARVILNTGEQVFVSIRFDERHTGGADKLFVRVARPQVGDNKAVGWRLPIIGSDDTRRLDARGIDPDDHMMLRRIPRLPE